MLQSIVFLSAVMTLWLVFAFITYVAFFYSLGFEESNAYMDSAQWITGTLAVSFVTLSFTGFNRLKLIHFFALRPAKFWQTFIFILICIIYSSIFMLQPSTAVHARALAADGVLFAILTTVIAAPIIEELIFRGGMFHDVSESIWAKIGVIFISSLTFLLLHTHYSPSTLIGLMPLAFFLGYARVKTNSIYPPILMHAFINSTIFIYIFLDV